MNINLDDPKLTAYALDELSGAEKTEMDRAIGASPAAQEFVRELRLLSGNLRAEYDAERESHPAPQTNIVPLPQEDAPWSMSRRLALAATIALCAALGAVAIGTVKLGRFSSREEVASYAAAPGPNLPPGVKESPVEGVEQAPTDPVQSLLKDEPAPPPPVAMAPSKTAGAAAVSTYAARQRPAAQHYASAPAEINLGNFERDAKRADFNTARYGKIEANPFLAALENPLSTFSIDVDTASYSNIRRFIENGSLPPKDAVRIEEMINYFAYDYPPPNDGAPFSVNLDAASCPWSPAHRLVRIGLKGREMPNEKRPASNLVFLLDVSGSMEPANRLPLVKQAMRLLVDKLGENDRVAIVVYSGASGLALPSTAGNRKEQILAALENLNAGGSTNGAQGIELAYQTAAEHFIKGGVNRVILATDGDFNIGTTSEGDIVRLIQEKAKGGVFLSVLGVGDDNLNDSMMQKLADKGNGNYAYLDSLDEARKVLVQQINGTLVTIAKDVKIQVEFNPALVASYRLIGYEKRILRKEDFNNDKIDAGEIGAGHTVTALYEVVPVGAETNPAASVPLVDPLKYQGGPTPSPAFRTAKRPQEEMLTVKLRYKEPEGETSKLLERPFVDDGKAFANAAPDFKFAAAVAEFGMILRQSEFKGQGSLGAVAEWAQEGKGADANGYRAGFLELARKAQR
ncbi:MAG: von Willebrand factor type A domain-containing protein [Chthoniobacterales bacterium]